MSRDRLNSKADLENKKAIAHFKSILCVLCVFVVIKNPQVSEIGDNLCIVTLDLGKKPGFSTAIYLPVGN